MRIKLWPDARDPLIRSASHPYASRLLEENSLHWMFITSSEQISILKQSLIKKNNKILCNYMQVCLFICFAICMSTTENVI